MDAAQRKRLSKLMSLLLRHRPEAAGLRLDRRGFCAVDELLRACRARLGFAVTRADLEALTAPAAAPQQKTRFELEGDFIRAGHGHSIPIEGYRPLASPPGPLYHATVRRALSAIRREGLRAMGRQKVHLAVDREITLEAARRRGRDTVLIAIDVTGALAAGVGFYASADFRVVLSDDIPPGFLRVEPPDQSV